MKIPPEDPADLPELIHGIRPGAGGVLLMQVRSDYDGSEEAARLAATGVFTEVRRFIGEFFDVTYAPTEDRPGVNWVLRLGCDLIREDVDFSPEIELGPTLTLGLIPQTNMTKYSEVSELVHVSNSPQVTRTITIPTQRGKVTGSLPPFLMALLPGWHVFGAGELLAQRAQDRLIKEVLRAVAESPAE